MVALGWYEVIKFLHVLLAIVAVGFNATYGVWLARAAREPEHEGFTLKGVKLLDDRFANPAYALLLVTGLLMVWIGDLDLTQFWLLSALVLYAVAVGLGLFGYTPTLSEPDRGARGWWGGLERVPGAVQARHDRPDRARGRRDR